MPVGIPRFVPALAEVDLLLLAEKSEAALHYHSTFALLALEIQLD